MKNIHILPTQNEITSKLFKVSNELKLTRKYDFYNGAKYQNIYITSDEEIKEGDYVIKISSLYKGGGIAQKYSFVDAQFEDIIFKKIILTTDPSLDGIQAIDDKFLEWFVKNASCEFVKILDDVECLPMPNIHINKHIYKIIIPQEEPKQMSKQTAVEWLIEQYINKNRGLEVFMKAIQMEKEQIIDAFKEGNLYHGWALKHEPEKYYNEIYKKEEK